jgi:regulatory protein YycI of two-component signal transduction system YycFG
MNLPLFVINVILILVNIFIAWQLFDNWRSLKAPKKTNFDAQLIRLKTLAIRLSYLANEGTLSKTGDTVRFDADGVYSANEFMDAIMEITELGR